MAVELIEVACESMELKYCERCGNLWLRRQGELEVYCESCVPRVMAVKRAKPIADSWSARVERAKEEVKVEHGLEDAAEPSALDAQIGTYSSALGAGVALAWVADALRRKADKNIYSQVGTQQDAVRRGLDECQAVCGEGGEA